MGPYQRGLVVLLPSVCAFLCVAVGRHGAGWAADPGLAIVAMPLGVVAYWLLRTWDRRRNG
jgi:hypothetical protein